MPSRPGGEGNIRSQNTFEPLLPGSLPDGVRLWNPSAGRGGQTEETLEEVRLRFAAAMRRPTTAVTEQDYEEIVKTVPGLCIRQVKAVRDEPRKQREHCRAAFLRGAVSRAFARV